MLFGTVSESYRESGLLFTQWWEWVDCIWNDLKEGEMSLYFFSDQVMFRQ